MFGRRHVMGVALAVTLLTAVIWLMGGPGPIPSEETQRVPIASPSPLMVDLDGDGQAESVWMSPGRQGNAKTVYPVVRRLGKNLTAAEAMNWPASGFAQLRIYEVSPKWKAVGVWMPWGKGGEGLGLYALEPQKIRFMGAFFAAGGVEVVDLDGDQTAEVVLRHGDGREPPEVYVLNKGVYVFSPAASARMRIETGVPARP